MEGLQSVGAVPVQVEGQPLHQEPGRLRAASPLLPERPQRNLQSEFNTVYSGTAGTSELCSTGYSVLPWLQVLLLSGCRPDIKNNYGDTPLHTAARYGHAGVIRILVSAKCNTSEQNKVSD